MKTVNPKAYHAKAIPCQALSILKEGVETSGEVESS